MVISSQNLCKMRCVSHPIAIEIIQVNGYEIRRGHLVICSINGFEVLPLNLQQRAISFGSGDKYSMKMTKIAWKSDIEITLSNFQS